MRDTYTRTLLYQDENTVTEFFWCDDILQNDNNYGIEELDLFDMLDEEEE